MTVTISPLTGPALGQALDDLARLRITVFRAYPYLYDGTLDYEATYLREFAKAKYGIIVAAKDGDSIIGCATGCALASQHAPLQRPFRNQGYDIDRIFYCGEFYCGESVLLPEYRGRGIGHAFFDHREAQARRCGYTLSTFCGVVRPDDHPLSPAGYSPLDAFWRKRGYRKAAGLTTTFGWKDVGEPAETDKPMQFWVKAL
jgi:GNAT superfamily N-acetyltransferase